MKHVLIGVVLLLISSYGPGARGDVQHVLENQYLRLGFDEQGRLIEMVNKKTDTQYVRPTPGGGIGRRLGEPSTPFVVDAYPANQSYHFQDYQEEQASGLSLAVPEVAKEKRGDLVHLRGAPDNLPMIETSTKAGEQTMRCVYLLDGGIKLTYTVTVPPESRLTEWKVHVNNEGTGDPGESVRVYRVAFPVLERLCIGTSPKSNYLARPYLQGELIPNPVDYAFRGGPRILGRPTYVLTYPGWASMPWMDLYKKSSSPTDSVASGLYLASYDPTFRQIDLESFPDHRRKTLTLGIRTLAYLEPGQSWESQRFMIGVHEGDWHWGADRYREDAKAWLKTSPAPEWLKECDGWFGSGGANYRFEDLTKMYEHARWLGLNYLQIWAQMIQLRDQDKASYYCFFLPDPERGGEQGLTEAVRAVRREGGHIGFYANVYTFDAELPAPLEKRKSQIPEDVKVPNWGSEFHRYASVFANGHVNAGNYKLQESGGYDWSGMCGEAEGWRDYLRFWVVDKYVRQYGVDAYYFDSLPVGMLGASRICFSRNHGDESPHGVGRGWIKLLQELRESAAPHVDLAVASEFACDALMQYQTHALGQELPGWTDYPRPEIYTYTFPEHILFSGSCNGWRGVTAYYDDLDRPTKKDGMDRVFLMGYRFDVLAYPLKEESDFALHMRRLIALRQKVKHELYDSTFRDTVGLGTLPAGVEARVFVGNGGGPITMTILDRRREKSSLPLFLDGRALGVSDLKRAVLYTLDGEAHALDVSKVPNKGIELNLPERRGAPAAVIVL